MGKIYQGESLNFVFRCKHRCGIPVNVEGMNVSVLVKDSFGETVYKFSTLALPEVKPVKVKDNCIVCRLSKEDTTVLSGSYALEVKVTRGNGELVMIDIVKGIKVYESVIGREVGL